MYDCLSLLSLSNKPRETYSNISGDGLTLLEPMNRNKKRSGIKKKKDSVDYHCYLKNRQVPYSSQSVCQLFWIFRNWSSVPVPEQLEMQGDIKQKHCPKTYGTKCPLC